VQRLYVEDVLNDSMAEPLSAAHRN